MSMATATLVQPTSPSTRDQAAVVNESKGNSTVCSPALPDTHIHSHLVECHATTGLTALVLPCLPPVAFLGHGSILPDAVMTQGGKPKSAGHHSNQQCLQGMAVSTSPAGPGPATPPTQASLRRLMCSSSFILGRERVAIAAGIFTSRSQDQPPCTGTLTPGLECTGGSPSQASSGLRSAEGPW